MPKQPVPPNEPGKWTHLETRGAACLWRRDRVDPMPVTQFYLLHPPRQAEIFYDEAEARARFEAASAITDHAGAATVNA